MPTLAQRLSDLSAADGVLGAMVSQSPTPVPNLPEGVYLARIKYAVAEGNTAEIHESALIVTDFAEPGEDSFWLRHLPEPLRTVPAVVYFSARTLSSITAAQIETYCNTKWETVHAGTDNIFNFSVVPVRGDTVLVSGIFEQGNNTWTPMEWYITLINPNAANPTADANVKFRQKV